MDGKGARGREAILDAASVLMDEHGVDHVSLNEINRVSGNRNRSAVTYHFGSRDAIVRELVNRSIAEVNVDRNALLDDRTDDQELSVREALEMVITPLAGRFETDAGRRYLRLIGQLINHPRFVADAAEALVLSDSVMRCVPAIMPALDHLPERVRAERVSQVIGFIVRATAEQARLLDTEQPPRAPLEPEDFVTNLVDVVYAMMSAPTTVPTVNGKR